MKAYKGFSKDMKCYNDFQYREGETYSTDKKPVRCAEHGFHSCENPVDVLRYYSPAGNVYHEVEVDGDIDRSDEDTKIASQTITIGGRISIQTMVDVAIEFVLSRCKNSRSKHSTGNRSVSSSSGYSSVSSSSGYSSVSLNNGWSSRSEVKNTDETESTNAVAIATGPDSKVKAPLGNWIVCSEWNADGTEMTRLKSSRIDGKKLKPDTLYAVKNNKWVKAD